jgi:hypothetical protein
MGTKQSLPQTAMNAVEVRGETNLKLEAQKIKDFSGGHEDWAKWKSRTQCAFSGSGYERVLEDEVYAALNERLNKVVYSQLAAATVEGVAYHLVSKHEDTKNGYAAWKSLVDWYDGDMIQNETAENLRNKLENLRLHTGVSASEYINKFLAWFRDLDKIKGEGLSKGHAVHLFLKNIIDDDYKTSVTYCRNTGCSLDLCIAAMRKQERDIQQKKVDRQRLKATLRRVKESQESDDEGSQDNKRRKTNRTRRTNTVNDKAENEKFAGELDTTEKGLLRFKSDCWMKMDEKEKEFVREYNASVKHGDPLDKLTVPDGISIKNRPRRTLIKKESDTDQSDQQARVKMNMRPHKKKGITFGVCPEDGVEYAEI